MSRRGRWIAAVALGVTAWSPPAYSEVAPTEYAIVPLAGGDTDIGFGAGALGSMAEVEEIDGGGGDGDGGPPYRWRLEGMVFATLKSHGGEVSSPYQDVFVQLTLPALLDGRLRLELRPSFTRESNLRYHGLGNAARARAPEVPARDFYARTHPALVARSRLGLGGPYSAQVGLILTYSWIHYQPGSNLDRDLREGSPAVRQLLHVDRAHALGLVEAGLVRDTRDDETAPSAGQYHTLKARVSPGLLPGFPYRYLQLDLNLRAYLAPWTPRLVFAGRLVADALVGTVPFYELSRFDEASAVGGANGVRGVPGDRYYGKRKLFGNLEARASLVRFRVRDARYELGAAGFFDAGRVWASLGSEPELDGGWPGLKYGTGLGLRLRKDTTFVLRTDLAWSPDARPLGFYFLAGHMY